MEKHLREFNKSVSGEQLKILSMEKTKSGHHRAIIENEEGKKMVYVLASTNSDRRATKNRLADIKRFFNN
jgi:hypothetical protein